MRPLSLTLLLVLLAAGCSHGAKRVAPRATPKLTACERARLAALRAPRHDVLRGDVDGDGVPDSVQLVRPATAPDRCIAFLLVHARARSLAQPLQGDRRVPEVPRLSGLAAIVPGRLHIVVTTWQGASTSFARVFAVRSGRIRPLFAPTADGTFPYDGSVTHFNAIDCVAPGSIVASGYFEKGAAGPPFGFERRFYRVTADGFVRLRTQKGTTRRNLSLQTPMREFREPQPFPSCMRARAR